MTPGRLRRTVVEPEAHHLSGGSVAVIAIQFRCTSKSVDRYAATIIVFTACPRALQIPPSVPQDHGASCCRQLPLKGILDSPGPQDQIKYSGPGPYHRRIPWLCPTKGGESDAHPFLGQDQVQDLTRNPQKSIICCHGEFTFDDIDSRELSPEAKTSKA